jgi:hypothetical protein
MDTTARHFDFATIDGSDDTVGGKSFLGDCRAAYGANSRPHLRTSGLGDPRSAVANIVAASQARQAAIPAIIIGHGLPGVIVTNRESCPEMEQLGLHSLALSGRPIFLSGEHIDINSIGALDSLHDHVSELTFAACNVGEGEVGDRFLRAVADRIGCPVNGHVCKVFCDATQGLTSRQSYKTAQPGATIVDMSQCDYPDTTFGDFLAPEMLAWRDEITTAGEPRPSIVSVTLNTMTGKPLFTRTGDDAKSLVEQANLHDPVTIHGVSGADVTGVLSVTLSNHRSRAFLLRGDQVLQDRVRPNTYFFVSRAFVKHCLNYANAP